jgi:hypothetical protein
MICKTTEATANFALLTVFLGSKITTLQSLLECGRLAAALASVAELFGV